MAHAHDVLLKRLAQLSVVAPADPPWRKNDRDGSTFMDHLKVMFVPGAATVSSRPLLVAAGFMLRHWLAPYVVFSAPLVALHRSYALVMEWHVISLFVLWLCAIIHCLCFDWQLRRSLWDSGKVCPGVFVPAGERAARIDVRLTTLHSSLKLTRWAWNGDMQTLVPADFDTVVRSVEKTGRLVVSHEAPRTSGFAAEIASTVAERCFLSLEAPVQRVCGYDTPFPLVFEKLYLPDVHKNVKAIRHVCSF